PAIRIALIDIEEGERRRSTRGPDELASAVGHLADLRARAEYAAMAPLLPELLYDATAAHPSTLAAVAKETSVSLRNLGYRARPLSAARIAVAAARDAEDLAWLGATRLVHTLALPVEAAATVSRVADRALGELQAGAAEPRTRQALGMLHLSVSLAC